MNDTIFYDQMNIQSTKDEGSHVVGDLPHAHDEV